MGDLNYRVAHPSVSEVHKLIANNDLDALLRRDQLLIEKAGGRAFAAFQELPIAFPPTYKYTPGTHDYERRANKKVRVPSWCDRIQWRSLNRNDFAPGDYRRAELLLSDHKPVALTAAFRAHSQSASTRRSLEAHLSQLSAPSVAPRVSISHAAVHWRDMRLGARLDFPILLRNTGNSVVRFTVLPTSLAAAVAMGHSLGHLQPVDPLRPEAVVLSAKWAVEQQPQQQDGNLSTPSAPGSGSSAVPALVSSLPGPTQPLSLPLGSRTLPCADHSAFWLTVSHASGLICPGEDVALTVTCHAAGPFAAKRIEAALGLADTLRTRARSAAAAAAAAGSSGESGTDSGAMGGPACALLAAAVVIRVQVRISLTYSLMYRVYSYQHCDETLCVP